MAEISLELFNRRFDEAEADCRETLHDTRELRRSIAELRVQVTEVEHRLTKLPSDRYAEA